MAQKKQAARKAASKKTAKRAAPAKKSKSSKASAKKAAPVKKAPAKKIAEKIAKKAPVKAAPAKKKAPVKKAPVKKAPVKKATPAKKAPVKKAPVKKATPAKRAPEKKAPEKKAPEKKVPEKKAPEKKAPEKKVPEKKVPEKKVPEKKVPEKKVPEEKVPEEKVPEEKVPVKTATVKKAQAKPEASKKALAIEEAAPVNEIPVVRDVPRKVSLAEKVQAEAAAPRFKPGKATSRYNVGDKVVHPQHGAATILKRIKREFSGEIRDYYVLDISTEPLTVMVPVEKVDSVVRSVISKTQSKNVLASLKDEPQEAGANWSRWYKVLTEKMYSGDIFQVAEVVRDLSFAQQTKGISPALKRMLSKARMTLISELSFSLEVDEEEATKRLDKALPRVENALIPIE